MIRSVLIVCHSLSSNCMGRVEVLWSVFRELGVDVKITSAESGPVWLPLRCNQLVLDSIEDRVAVECDRFDLIVSQKCLFSTVILSRRLAKKGNTPVVYDVDDPDFENLFGSGAIKFLLKNILKPSRIISFSREFHARNIVKRGLKFLSNPSLAELYGPGHVLPHAKPVSTLSEEATVQSSPNVAFVGTPRGHKGIDALRQACHALGMGLIVTADTPADRMSNETWLGEVSQADGLRVLREADIVVIPSLRTSMSLAQLPMKLIDAMAMGKPILAADLPPIRWALGSSGLLFASGSSAGLLEGLKTLFDPDLRRELGQMALTKFSNEFTVPIVADRLRTFLDESLPHQ